MYVPSELWAMIKVHAPVKDWVRASAICRTTYELRRRILSAEVRSCLGNHEHIPTDHLQLEKWVDCHSLFFNMRQLHKAGRLTSYQIKRMTDASLSLPDLHCLHIIGRDQQPLTSGGRSIESKLVELLAKHVQVLTLQVTKLAMPLDMPSLQHLLLDLDTVPYYDMCSIAWWYHDTLLPALSHLKRLKTLYVQSMRKGVYVCDNSSNVGPARGLRDCVHLQHVVLQGVRFAENISVPAGCSVQVICMPSHVIGFTGRCSPMLTGLILRHSSSFRPDPRPYWSYSELLPDHEFCGLKSLRLALRKDQLSEKCRERESLQLNFPSSGVPLEVLELDVECDLAVFIDPKHTLKLLVVIASGSLTFHESLLELEPCSPLWQCSRLCEPPITTVKHMYLRSGKSFSKKYMAALEASHAYKQHVEMRFLDYVSEEQCGWKAHMPANFQPSSLHECCCQAS